MRASSQMDDEALATLFGVGSFTRTGVTARGEMGEVWQVAAPTGTFALKRIFEPVDDDEVEEEVALASAARAAGAPVPEIIRTVDGSVVVEGRWRLFEWVDRLAVDVTIDPAAVGGAVARIHRSAFVGARGEHWWYTDPVGTVRWKELARSAAPWAERLDGLRADLVELESWLRPARSLQTCHRDLWADNVRATEEGGVCVIDWDNCGLADPAQELALVLVEFAADDEARARTLLDAYADAGGPG
jgi:Ser/Thr protein kinase RdoA (MazF antagonist)